MNIIPKRCLIIAPHTDDGEFGCGASISKFVEMGVDVHYVAFSICEESVPPQFDPRILEDEVKIATSILGIKKENLYIKGLKVRYFPENRQTILQTLVDLNRSLKPDLVICPSSDDVHQDHHTVYEEACRAFKKTTLLGYELPWNNTRFSTSCFIGISEEHLKSKIKAIKAYESQGQRSYVNDEFIRSLAVMRGMQGGCNLAESFEVIKLSWD